MIQSLIRLSIIIAAGMLFGCTAEDGSVGVDEQVDSGGTPTEPAVEAVWTVVPVGELQPIIETLRVDAIDAVALAGHVTLVKTEDELLLHDETRSDAPSLGAANHAGGTALDAHNLLLLLDESLQVFDGTHLRPSPLDALLPFPVASVAGDLEHLWLLGGGQLFHHSEGRLTTANIDGDREVRMMAPGPDSLVAVMAPHLLVLDGYSGELEVRDFQPDRLAQHMTFDREGFLWVADGSTVLARRTPSGEWGAVDVGAAISSLSGHPESAELWIHTESGALHHRDGSFHTAATPEGAWLGVDPLGRLLILGDDGLQRVAARRVVAVAGLQPDAPLEAAVTVSFAPTDPDSVEHLDAWIGTRQLSLDPETLTATIDPTMLAPGSQTLRVAATGPEGTTLTDLSFRIGELPDATWESDIAPIMEQHCSRCHGSGASIPLHTADAWRLNIDRVLSEIVANEMPLGGPYLSNEELSLIRGWQAGDFQ